jgi:hypothetical protein
MKLKTLINILTTTNSYKTERVKIYWKDREELLSKIIDRHTSFEDSTEPMNNPEVITDLIINMSDKIKIYQKQELPEEELLKRAPKDNLELIDTLKQIIEDRNIVENKRDGSFFIELNRDELYEIFSLESLRQRQLNKII